ncbi:MAG: DUF2029 domain-containing protein [candidate division Zixibacteria bacterium]|nr:DUF2029 domain-containing protein [candidate division Zixibacteria bacterium]
MSGRKITRVATAVALAGVLLYAVYCVIVIATHSDLYQWDFRSYYYAARASADGGNPYDPADLSRVAGGGNVLRFVYPPVTLVAFAPFAALPYSVAAQIWLVLKLVALGLLIYLWMKHVVTVRSEIAFALLVLFGLGRTILVDLAAGNISIFEQCLLWAGLVCLLRRRTWLFCLAVLIVSCFKLFPILFVLLLLVLPNVKQRWSALAATVGAFLTILGLDYARDPARFTHFVATAVAIREHGDLGDPSLLAFIRDLADRLGAVAGMPLGGMAPMLAYGAAAAAIAIITLSHLRALRRSGSFDSAASLILLFCVGYALTLPRFKNYSFILLLPAAYVAQRDLRRRSMQWLFLLLLAIPISPAIPIALPGSFNLRIHWHYHPLLLAFVIWLFCLYQTRFPFAADQSSSRGARPMD